jgi:hypothetical protein
VAPGWWRLAARDGPGPRPRPAISPKASQLTTAIGEGPSDRIRFPGNGPYDRRFGYTRLPTALETATEQGYRIAAQVRVSERFAEVVDRGVFPIFREKTQAALIPTDAVRRSSISLPEHACSVDLTGRGRRRSSNWAFRPALNRNPSVDRSRMARRPPISRWPGWGATAGAGASTLASTESSDTDEGRTRTAREPVPRWRPPAAKLHRGEHGGRRRIAADHLNSAVAAIAGHGEVTGLGDGLGRYGADPTRCEPWAGEGRRDGSSPALAQTRRRLPQVLA